MGLFSWLTDSLPGNDRPDGGTPMMPGPGSQVGQLDPMGAATGQMIPLPTPAPAPTSDMLSPPGLPPPGSGMLNFQRPEFDPSRAPFPRAEDPMTAGGPVPNGPGLPPAPFPPGGDPMTAGGIPDNGPGLPVPLPTPRPPGLGGSPGPAAPPPNAAPGGGAGMPPGPPMGIGTGINGVGPGLGVATLDQLRGSPGAQTIIGRALGLDGNRELQLRGALGAGFKAAGESAGKSPGQAFASGLGAGIEGGKKADDTTTAQQDKYLQRAIQAQREGNHAAYQTNYLKYQIESTKERLRLVKEKQASGSASVMNSPQQLYLRADTTAISSAAALKSQYDKTAQQFGADSKEAKAALEVYNKGVDSVRAELYGKLGLDPKKATEIAGQPGMSDKNPIKDFPKDAAAAQKQFDALPDGAWFVNPKDGRLLRKKTSAQQGGGQPQQQTSGLTPPMPPTPTDPNDSLNQEAA